MTYLRKTWLPLAIEAHRQLKAAMPRHWWLIGGLPRLCQWEKREKMGKTSKNFSGCCVYLCFLVHFHPFSQFVFLRRSNLPVKQKQRALGAMSGLPRPCHVTVLRPFCVGSSVDRRSFRHIQMLAKQQSHTLTLGQLMRTALATYQCFWGVGSSMILVRVWIRESWLANVSR